MWESSGGWLVAWDVSTQHCLQVVTVSEPTSHFLVVPQDINSLCCSDLHICAWVPLVEGKYNWLHICIYMLPTPQCRDLA